MAGGATALVTLPMTIGMGVVALAPLGAEYAALGALAGLYSAFFLSVVPALFRPTPQQVLSPSPISSGIFAAIIVMLMTDPHVTELAGTEPAARASLVLTLAFLCAFLAAALQLLIGLLELGELVKLIPHPVIAGVVNGVALKIILSQLPPLLGQSEGDRLGGVNPMDAALGLATIAIIVVFSRWTRRVPGAVVGLVAGTSLYALLSHFGGNVGLGPTLGHIPWAWPTPAEGARMAGLLSHPELPLLLLKLAGMAVTLAILGAFSALLTATTADTLSNTRHDSRRELAALGAGNMVTVLFAGVPGGGSLSKIMNNHRFGGRTGLAQVSCGLATLGLAAVGGALLSRVPLSVLAGVLIVLSAGFIDGWSREALRRVFRLKNRELRLNLTANICIVLLVVVLVLQRGLVDAIVAGLIASFVMYLHQSQESIIRRSYTAARVQSKTVRRHEAVEALQAHGSSILVLELQGPLFFGTADRLAREIDEMSRQADTLILDFKRVSSVDSSAALLLRRVRLRLESEGRTLLLSYLPEDDERLLSMQEARLEGSERGPSVFADTNAALAAAEDALLVGLDPELVSEQETSLARASLFQDLTGEEIEAVCRHMERRVYPRDEKIIKENEAADGFYILVHGRVSILKKQVDTGRQVPLVKLGPGVSFGELALLSGGVRTADVCASTRAVCYFMSLDRFNRLRAEDPLLTNKLLINIGVSMARRLAASSETISELES